MIILSKGYWSPDADSESAAIVAAQQFMGQPLRQTLLAIPTVGSCTFKGGADLPFLTDEAVVRVHVAYAETNTVDLIFNLLGRAVYRLDLHLMLQAENLGYATPTQHAGVVFNANAALVAYVNQPYSTLIAQKRFPEGSVLDQVLSAKEVKASGLTWPLVRRVHASYDYLHDRWSEYSPSGFKVEVEYQADPASDVGERRDAFVITSGLDPCRTEDGLASPAPFTAADTLGVVEGRGYLESWHGDDEAIEKAKAKYLMNTNTPALTLDGK